MCSGKDPRPASSLPWQELQGAQCPCSGIAVSSAASTSSLSGGRKKLQNLMGCRQKTFPLPYPSLCASELSTNQRNRKRLRDLEKELKGYEGKGGERDSLGVWDWRVHTAICKMDNQQGPTVEHRELCSIFCNNLNGKSIWKRIDTCICITESLCCPPLL